MKQTKPPRGNNARKISHSRATARLMGKSSLRGAISGLGAVFVIIDDLERANR
jgi:hypothetical protein